MNGEQWETKFNEMPFEVLEKTVTSMAKLPAIISYEFDGLLEVYTTAKQIYIKRQETEGRVELSMAQLREISEKTGHSIKLTNDGTKVIARLF